MTLKVEGSEKRFKLKEKKNENLKFLRLFFPENSLEKFYESDPLCEAHKRIYKKICFLPEKRLEFHAKTHKKLHNQASIDQNSIKESLRIVFVSRQLLPLN